MNATVKTAQAILAPQPCMVAAKLRIAGKHANRRMIQKAIRHAQRSGQTEATISGITFCW